MPRPGIFNAILRRKKRRLIAKAGAVSTDRSSQVRRKTARRRAANGSQPNKKPTRIANCVGAASRDVKERKWFRQPRPIASAEVGSVIQRQKKRPRTVVYLKRAGAA